MQEMQKFAGPPQDAPNRLSIGCGHVAASCARSFSAGQVMPAF
jgi:hypothetical protein